MSSPYDVISFEGTYQFATVNNIEYVCTFSDVTENFDHFDTQGCRILLFNLTLTSQGIKPAFDSRVGITVINILKQFFVKNDDVLVYVADTMDGRHERRRMKFNRWLRDYPIQDVVIDEYQYENFLAGIIRKAIEHHRIISCEIRKHFNVLKGEYLS